MNEGELVSFRYDLRAHALVGKYLQQEGVWYVAADKVDFGYAIFHGE